MKNRVTVTIDDSLQNRVAATAESEQRSFSAMVSGLLFEALQARAKPPFVPPSVPVFLGSPGFLEAESPVLDAVSPDVRENVEKTPFRRDKKCVHMAEPEDFCPVCDSGVT